jgi:hypothetical protein
VVLATTAASEETFLYFYNSQQCSSMSVLTDFLSFSGQTPLFTTNTVQYGADSTKYWGESVFFVNQDIGTWTLGTMYADGNVCVTASGTNFEPFGG